MTRPTGRFTRSDRLRDPRDYRRVSRRGQRRSSDAFVVLRVRRDEGARGSESAANRTSEGRNRRVGSAPAGARIGITASRKVGNAVVRNRIKRRVREWYRRHRCELRGDEDVVVIARKPAARLAGVEIDAMLCRLLAIGEDARGGRR